MKQYRKNKGIGLIEVVVVVTLSMIVFTAMMRMLIHAQRVEVVADAHTRLVLFCQEKMSELKAKPFSELEPGEYTVEKESKYPLQAVVKITALQAGTLKKIEIAGRSELPRGTRTISVESLRTAYE